MEQLPYPQPSSAAVTRSMRGNRRRDTGPERAVRSALHERGMRFRVDLPIRTPERLIRPDIVFTRARLAVFIDGCFWHCCPIHGTSPKTNTDYWSPKLRRNVERDRVVNQALAGSGWTVVRAWEHEDPADVVERVVFAYAQLVA